MRYVLVLCASAMCYALYAMRYALCAMRYALHAMRYMVCVCANASTMVVHQCQLKVLHKALPGKGNAGCPMASARHGWAHAGCPWPGGSRRARLGAPGAAQGIARARLSAQGAAQGGNYLFPPTVAH